ncbi:T9SS C-terminal target domain-containing protein [Flexithrix dorotheae]|uniref:T9SS C-terminal target domain-containing protein n=1 Tax=Flexithrix dorotheae TaxID=70993 RepID=UPI00039E5E2B|nr:T9SS C-terminal target domain-containing protein [Flexithrix dorotheae]
MAKNYKTLQNFRWILLITFFILGNNLMAQEDIKLVSGSVEKGCIPFSVEFEVTGLDPSKTVTNYKWDLGDNIKPEGAGRQKVGRIYNTSGTFTIKVEIYYDNSPTPDAIVTKTDFVEVFEGPQAEFTYSAIGGCKGDTIYFKDKSDGVSGNIDDSKTIWEFGNGGSATGKNVFYVFNEAGVFDVAVFVEDDNGCRAAIKKTGLITIIDDLDVDFITNDIRISCGNDLTVKFNDNTSIGSPGSLTYLWEFGDGSTSTDKDPTHTYSKTGSDPDLFDVTLTVTHESGCSQTFTRDDYIQLHDFTADFDMSLITTCTPMQVNFKDNSSPQFSFQNVSWDFGDGNSDTGRDVNHTFNNNTTTTQTRTITMTITGGDGTCVGVVTKTLDIPPQLVADIQADHTEFCADNFTVTFDGSASENAVNYKIDFGDGNSITGAGTPPNNISHNFTSHGVFDVRLTIDDGLGCEETETIRIESQPIDVDFRIDGNREGCEPLAIQLENRTSTLGSISVTDWFWEVYNQDNVLVKTSTDEEPNFNLNTGTYKIKLTASNSECSEDFTRYNYVRVGMPPISLDFTPSKTVICNGTRVDFANNSVTDPSNPFPTFFEWDYTNSGNWQSAYNGSNVYDNLPAGPITVAMRAYSNGCYSEPIYKTITMEVPLADFDVIIDNCDPGRLEIVNQSQNAQLHSWKYFDDAGNADFSTDLNPVWQVEPGVTATIELEVFNNAPLGGIGCYDYHERVVTMPAPLPDLNPTASDHNICIGDKINFDAVFVGGSNYKWKFGDGQNKSGKTPEVTFNKAGTFDVELQVTSNGCVVDTLLQDWITVTGPNVKLVKDKSNGCAPLTVNFEDQSTFHGATFKSRIWKVDNVAQPETSANFTYTFTEPKAKQSDRYKVTLVVETNEGCNYSKSTWIRATMPKPDFTMDSVRSCGTMEVSFVGVKHDSTAYEPKYKWSTTTSGITFSPSSSNRKPKANFPDGTHEVTLEVTDKYGCTNTITKTFEINLGHQLEALFTADPVEVNCPPAAISFQDTSMGKVPVVAWLWDFGDGATSTLQNPTRIYDRPNPQGFDVTLTVWDSINCSHSVTITDFVKVKGPDGTFAVDDTIGYEPFEVNFEGTSDNVTNSYQWQYGDGDLTLKTPQDSIKSKIYNPVTAGLPSKFEPEMILYDTAGCRFSTPSDIAITVLPCPTLDIGNDTTYCINFGDQTLNAFNPSHNITLGTIHYEWRVDGGAVFSNDPSITLPAVISTKTYTVDLYILDNGDTVCAKSDTVEVIFEDGPYGKFKIDPFQNLCEGVTIDFTNTSTFPPISGRDSIRWDFDGDGIFDEGDLDNPFWSYSTAGTYQATLEVFAGNGCSDIFIREIVINPLPVPEFSTENLCDGETVQFYDSSTVAVGNVIGWEWDFDNDGTPDSFIQNPQHLFSGGTGIYPVTLRAITDSTCNEVITKDVHIYPLPTPKLAPSSNEVCFNEVITFDASASNVANPGGVTPVPAIDQYEWDFNYDGSNFNIEATTSNSTATIDYNFATHGAYKVAVRVVTNNGCSAIETTDIIVNPKPVANFTIDNVCVDSDVQAGISNSSDVVNFNGSLIDKYQWDFDYDGTTFTEDALGETPSFAHSVAGDYTVALITTTNKGCKDTTTQNITIYPKPVVDFDISNVCDGVTLLFFDNSTIPVGYSNVQFEWDFDGEKVYGRNAKKVYPTPASYPATKSITLTVTSDKGCISSTTKTFDLTTDQIPVPGFTFTGFCADESFSFDGSSSSVGSGGITNWEWDFNNDSIFEDSGELITAPPFNHQGDHPVTLRVTTDKGCQELVTIDVPVDDPQVDFGYTSINVCMGDSIFFWDQTTFPDPVYGSRVPGIVHWEWDFKNDGTEVLNGADKDKVGFVYEKAGDYDVRLTITTALGCERTLIKTITIHPDPIPVFSVSEACQYAENIFTDNITTIHPDYKGDSIPGNTITAWYWDFGDFSRPELTATGEASHTYNFPGTYQAYLIAETDKSCNDTSAVVDVIVHPAPVADFSMDANCQGVDINFTDLSTLETDANGDSIPGNKIEAWYWSFGNGDIATTQNPNITYIVPDTVLVSLRVVTNQDESCSDLIIKPLVIHPSPITDFVADTVCHGGITQFTDASILTPNSDGNQPPGNEIGLWQWDFGDGKKGFIQNPAHEYEEPGTYTVILTTYTDKECFSSDTSEVIVRPNPIADFEATSVCFGNTTVFTDKSTVEKDMNGDEILTSVINTWSWDFDGDGKEDSNLQHPTFDYTAAGTYDVTLTVTTNNGCSHFITYPVKVHPVPEVVFLSENLCNGQVSFFIDSTSLPFPETDFLSTWVWDFGTSIGGVAMTSTKQNPSITYPDAGVYKVTLTVTTNNGCISQTSQELTVYQSPVADFNTENVCFGSEAQFISTSNDAGRDFVSQEWDFDHDGKFELEGAEVGFIYDEPGDYEVLLKVTSITGCVDTIVKPITIYSLPEAYAGIDKRLCDGERTSLSATGGLTYLWSTGETTKGINVLPEETTTYTVTVQDENGCLSFDSVRVVVVPEPILNADTAVCQGEIPILDASIVGYDAKYLWSTGDRSARIAVTEPGDYFVEAVVDYLGKECIFTKTITVNFDSIPTIETLPEEQIHCFEDGPLKLDAGAGSAYTWSNDMTTQIIEVEKEGIYHVIVENSVGCTSRKSVKVTELCPPRVYFPTAFTPNGDGVNDDFKPEWAHMVAFELIIYNRWGEPIFKTTEPTKGWIGDYLGKDMPSGTYPYKVTYTSELEPDKEIIYSGSVLLIR